MSLKRVLVGVKRVVDYAVRVRVAGAASNGWELNAGVKALKLGRACANELCVGWFARACFSPQKS